MKKCMKCGGSHKKMKKGGSKFPDLTGDGKTTYADVLKGRGVFESGGMVGMPKYPNNSRTIQGRMLRNGGATVNMKQYPFND
jgi:hypothetical protein